jgi:hypothetical protein
LPHFAQFPRLIAGGTVKREAPQRQAQSWFIMPFRVATSLLLITPVQALKRLSLRSGRAAS